MIPELGIEFTVLQCKGTLTRVGVVAPKEVAVHRREVHERTKDAAPAKATAK